MEAKQVTVFGGSGFLGRHTVRALAKAGWRIKVGAAIPIALFSCARWARSARSASSNATSPIPTRSPRRFRAPHAAVNLPGILFQRGQSFRGCPCRRRRPCRRSRGARRASGALVHVSAIGADTRIRIPRYAQTKAEGEKRVRAAFPAAVILRPSIVFGPEDHFFNNFAELARISPALPLIGGGQTRFQPVFVGDVAAAIAAALDNPAAQGQTYELGGPDDLQLQGIDADRAARNRPQAPLVPLPFALASLKAVLPAIGAQAAPDARSGQAAEVMTMWCRRPRPALADLGIAPTTVEAEVPAYLWRFRAKGEYADLRPGKATRLRSSR